MSLWDEITEKYRILVKIDNSGNTAHKYYSDTPGGLIDSIRYEPKIISISPIIIKAPKPLDKTFPQSNCSLTIVAEDADRTFFSTTLNMQCLVSIYIADYDESVLSNSTKIFQGYVNFPTGTNIGLDTIDLNISGIHKNLDKEYPMYEKGGYDKKEVEGIWTVEEKNNNFPLIIGNYCLDSASNWDYALYERVPESIDSSNEKAIRPVEFQSLTLRNMSGKKIKPPSFLGTLANTKCLLCDQSIMNSSSLEDDRMRTVNNTEKFKDIESFESNPFEGFEKRYAGVESIFESASLVEIGVWHQPCWYNYQNFGASDKIVSITGGYSFDYLLIESITQRYLDMQKFWYIYSDGTNLKSQGASFDGKIEHSSGSILQSCTLRSGALIGKNLFGYSILNSYGGSDFHIGTWHMYRNTGGQPLLNIISVYDTSSNFNTEWVTPFSSSFTNYDLEYPFSWVDGDFKPAEFVSGSATWTNLYTAILLQAGNKGWVFSYDVFPTDPINQLNDTGSWISNAESLKGACSFFVTGIKEGATSLDFEDIEWDWRQVHHNHNRLLFFSTKSGSHFYFHRIEEEMDILNHRTCCVPVSAYDDTTYNNMYTNCEIAGLFINGWTVDALTNKQATPSMWCVFFNDTSSNKIGLMTKVGRNRENRYIDLEDIEDNPTYIYDVQEISRSRKEAALFFATNKGVYWCDPVKLFFGSGKTGQLGIASYDQRDNYSDSDICKEFKLISTDVVNNLGSFKYSGFSWPLKEYKDITVPHSLEGHWKIYMSGVSIDNSSSSIARFVPRWSGSQTYDNTMYFTTQFDKSDELGWYGKAGYDVNEQERWERLAGYLIHKAEGNADFTYSPSLIHSESWYSESIKRGNDFSGQIRYNSMVKKPVIQHVHDILRQCFQTLYPIYCGSEPQLKIKYMFQNPDNSPLELTTFNASNPEIRLFDNYSSKIIMKTNKLNKNYFSTLSHELSGPLFANEQIYDMSMIVGVENETSTASCLFNKGTDYLLKVISGYENKTNDYTDPLRSLTIDVGPSLWDTELMTDIEIKNDDNFGWDFCEGDWILYEKIIDLTNMSGQFYLVEHTGYSF